MVCQTTVCELSKNFGKVGAGEEERHHAHEVDCLDRQDAEHEAGQAGLPRCRERQHRGQEDDHGLDAVAAVLDVDGEGLRVEPDDRPGLGDVLAEDFSATPLASATPAVNGTTKPSLTGCKREEGERGGEDDEKETDERELASILADRRARAPGGRRTLRRSRTSSLGHSWAGLYATGRRFRTLRAILPIADARLTSTRSPIYHPSGSGRLSRRLPRRRCLHISLLQHSPPRPRLAESIRHGTGASE